MAIYLAQDFWNENTCRMFGTTFGKLPVKLGTYDYDGVILI